MIAALVMVVAGFGMGMLIKGAFYSMCVQIATAVVVYAIFMILIKPAPVRVLMDKFKNRN